MAGYAKAPADVDVEKAEALQRRSCAGWMWTALGGVLAVALCLGGLQLFALYWSGRPEATAAEQKAPTQMDLAAPTLAARARLTLPSSDPRHMLEQLSGGAKAAIHLVGAYEEDESSALEWRDDEGQAFTHGDFRLRDNRVVVPHGGLFFVYSQASFRVPCGEEAGAPPSHRIWRLSDSIGNKVSLMSAVRSVCQAGAQDGEGGAGWYSTIYLGAVFQLNKGDQLWTETNLLPELETGEGKTFFGVFAL